MAQHDAKYYNCIQHLARLAEAVLSPTTQAEERERLAQEATKYLEEKALVHRGICVADMPGTDLGARCIAFAALRRGCHLHQAALDGLTGPALREKLNQLASRSRANGAKSKLAIAFLT